jgi:hypothetical protein
VRDVLKIDLETRVGEHETGVDRCELCGTVAELRPYGPKGARICHACGLKDEEATNRRMLASWLGLTPPK